MTTPDRSKACRARQSALQVAAVAGLRTSLAICAAVGVALIPRGQSVSVMQREGKRTWKQTDSVPLPDIETPEFAD